MRAARLAASLMGIGLAMGCFGAEPERPVQLPDFHVEGDMPQTRMPRDQMYEMRTTVEERYRTFALDSYTVVKYARSPVKTAIKSLIRDANGKVVADITTERGVYEVTAQYAGLFAASNQPAEQSGLFFLLKIRCDRRDITLGFMEDLFREYSDFSARRLELVRRQYRSKRKDEFKELSHVMTADEIVIVASDAAAASKIAAKLAVKADGRGIRVPAVQLKEMTARLGRDFRVSDDPAAIDYLSPWRHDEALPAAKEHCALLAIGWAVYRPQFFSHYRYEVIVPGIMNSPEARKPGP